MRALTHVLIGAVFGGVSLHAQGHPRTREGLTVSAGLGLGSASFDGARCAPCKTDDVSGVAGYVRLGATVFAHLIVGAEVNEWVQTERGGASSIRTVNAVAQVYPLASGGFYAEVGVGLGNSKLTTSKSGRGFQFGGGYDWRLARNVSLTPNLKYFESETNSHTIGEFLRARVLELGLGVTWH